MYMNFFSTNPLQNETTNTRLDNIEELLMKNEETLKELNERLQRIEQYLSIFVKTYTIMENGETLQFTF